MSHALIIAGRELRERPRIFLMAAAMAVLPFLTTLIPATRANRAEFIVMLAGFLAVALSTGIAIAHGASTIAGELVERRLSFYFTKPISPAALWFGKAIAALVTSFACFAIVAVPAMLATGGEWQQWFGGGLVGWFALAVVALFLATHALSTMVRSHSAQIGLDFLLAAGTVAAILAMVKPMILGAGLDVALRLLAAIGVALLAILFVAPVWQLAQGRTDIRRSHAALSRALWIPIAAVLLVAGAFVFWFMSVDPHELAVITNLEQAPGGRAVFLTGTTKGRGEYHSSFIVDTNSGRHARVDAPAWWGSQFSRDGNVAAWAQPASMLGHVSRVELYTKRIGEGTRATGIRTSPASWFAISDDGSRLAVFDGGVLAVHDLANDRILASTPITPSVNHRVLYFAGRDVVRVMESQRGSTQLVIFELNAATRKYAKTGEVESPAPFGGVRASLDGTRLLLPREGLVIDARTGAKIGTLPVQTKNQFATAILRDGTIAIMKDGRLQTFAADGTPLRQIALPAKRGWIAGEVEGGKLIVLGYDEVRQDPTGRGKRMLVIDVARGAVERTMNDLKGPGPSWSDPRLSQFPAGQPLTAVNGEGKLVLWDPLTGAVKPFPRS